MNTKWLIGAMAAGVLCVGCGDDDNGDSDGDNTGGNNTAGTNDGNNTSADEDGGASDNNTGNNSNNSGDKTNTIVDIAVGNPDFETLVAALQRAELDDDLAGKGPFTVFAPTDAAFEALGVDLATISDEQLKQILLYHVIGAEVEAADVPSDPPKADALSGLTLWFNTKDGVKVNDAKVTTADIAADNGVIHVIDKVLLPPDVPTMAGFAGLTSLVAAASEAKLVDALKAEGPFTVFAPTDAAFAALLTTLGAATVSDIEDAVLTETLLYHVVAKKVAAKDIASGLSVAPTLSNSIHDQKMTLLINKTDSKVQVNLATVAVADINTTNGVVHVIDKVMTAPTIVDMAGIAGLTSLAGALGAASGDLDTLLAGNGPYTVFAPTNAAFGAITAPTDPNQLRDVLLYHVVTSDPPVLSTALAAGEVPTALTGQTLTVVTTPKVTIDGANVVIADVVTKNGAVHVVDKVLVP
jgi:transforming growth factor-beta-induced protein